MSDEKRKLTPEEIAEIKKLMACIETCLENQLRVSKRWKEEEREWLRNHMWYLIMDLIIGGTLFVIGIVTICKSIID